MTQPDPTPAKAGVPAAPSPSGGGPAPSAAQDASTAKRPREIGGPSGPEPTRYGDWERNGRVSDF
jgi:hypothetical protein